MIDLEGEGRDDDSAEVILGIPTLSAYHKNEDLNEMEQ